jgi:hypothetical protein
LLFMRTLLGPDFMSTKLPRSVDNATEKGEVMEPTSKGNFIDFIEHVSPEGSPLREGFLRVYNKQDVTAEEFLEFFHAESYFGVSLEDCKKLSSVANLGPLPLDLTVKY